MYRVYMIFNMCHNYECCKVEVDVGGDVASQVICDDLFINLISIALKNHL